jgi:hypothetical integral membrane protein (TIGR02206 family)
VPDPEFVPFTLQHALTVAVGGAILAALLIVGRRGGFPERTARALLAFANLAVLGFAPWAWSTVGGGTDLSASIPLHLCDIAAVCAGFALITGRRLPMLLTYFWGLAGTVQGILTPAIDIGFPHPANFAFFIQHFAIIGAALYFPVVLNWRPRGPWWHAPAIAFAWLNVYLLVALTANRLLGTNYGFLAQKPANPSLLDHLGPHPVYIFWLELVALAIFALLALPLRARRSA